MNNSLVSELKTPEARLALAEAVVALFRQWHIHEVNQLELLSMHNTAHLRMDEPLPDDPEVLERTGQMLAIERALYKAFPYEPDRRNTWVLAPLDALHGDAPINKMLEGLDGIKQVRELIEAQIPV